jgi:hypothetical protein
LLELNQVVKKNILFSDEADEEETMKETLIPVVQRHVVQFNTPTQRFDIHGNLQIDTISMQSILGENIFSVYVNEYTRS